MPSISVFQYLLQQNQRGAHFVLADYNPEVLRLVTIPNLILSWVMITLSSPTSTNNNNYDTWAADSDVDITPELLDRFENDLKSRDIVIDTISGAWGEEFLIEVPFSPSSSRLLVLASETIYSPDTLPSFIRVLAETARSSRVLVAAKKVYFGVGGGVDDFVREWERIGGATDRVMEVGDDGVARVVLSVYK